MNMIFSEFNPEKIEQIRNHPYYAKLRESVIKRAEYFMDNDPEVIKFSKIHLYETTGNREIFEGVHSDYQARLQNLLFAYVITDDDKYIEPLADIIWNICDMESWSIPAHVREYLPTVRRRRNLDLCSCLLGHRLAEAITYTKDKLPELVYRRAKEEITYRVIDAFADYSEKEFWWYKVTNNWASVCISGVLGSYLCLADDAKIKEQLPRMIAIADNYLKGFKDDACCVEGYSYWIYGFSYFCVFAKLLYDYTDGEINYFANEKVHNIALFQQNVLMNERECLSFSDCPVSFNPEIWLSHFLKGIYPDMQLPELPDECHTNPDEHLRLAFWTNPDIPKSTTKLVGHIFRDAEWFLHHGSTYALGAKAGHNNEFHNHNDVGSFLVSKGGRVTFCDPGGGEYTKDYFGPNRYSIFVTSGRAHSVPIINGECQSFGEREGHVEIFDSDRFKFSMKGGYEIDTLTSLVRDFECFEDSVRLTDTYEFSETPTSVTERFVSLLPIEEKDGTLICGDSVLVFDKDAFDVSFGSEVVPRKRADSETVYYVDLCLKNPKKQFELTFIIK